jgi:hypothetical protein
MLCTDACVGEEPRIGEVVTVDIELPENPVFGRKCIHCQATVVRISGADDSRGFRLAFSVNQMKFAEYSRSAVQFQEMEAGAGSLQV